MKALYILFGLLLLTTVSSDPSTPFLVDGYIQYSNGDPVNDPRVNLTKLNTGEVFTAETTANCYQILPVNISAGDVVSFNVTDGVTYNITNHIVTMDDLDSGGIFDFSLILLSTSPGITDFSPDSPVHDVENATRTFSITIDQVVNVTWLINGTTVQTDMGVTHASCTNTSATAGIWNVSAIASNENKTAMQTWTWDVAMRPELNITLFTPPSPVYDVENATRTFGITIDQVVNVTWLINGTEVQVNKSTNDTSYTNTSAIIGIWNVSAITSNENGTAIQTWTWDVAMLPELNITSFTPPSPVYDVENATRTFSITIDQVVNVTWLINGITVQTDMGVTHASYINASAIPGICNVSAIVSNGNGTATKTWIWNVKSSCTVEVTAQSTVNSTSPFMIYGWVFYNNGSECIYPVLNISNLNISMGWQAQTLDASHYYQLVLDTANIMAGNVIRIDASKDGAIWSVDHTIGLDDIDNGIIEVNINEEGVLPDLTVTQVFSPHEWLIANSNNTITAEIKNDGTAITDEFNISLTTNGTLIDEITITSMVTGATKPVSFNWEPNHNGNYLLVVEADSDNIINESNEINNNFSMTVFVGEPDFVVTAIEYDLSSPVNDTDPVNVTATINNMGSVGAWVDVDFSIAEKWEEYYFNEMKFASNHVYIGASEINTTSAVWNATCSLLFGSELDSKYEIKVTANDSSRTKNLNVTPSRDFTVVNINPSSPTVIFGDNVTLNITLENCGIRTGDAEIYVSVDNGVKIESIYSTSRTLEPGIQDYIVFDWDTGSTNLGGDCNISVEVDPYKKISEINETNNEMTNYTFVNGTDLVVHVESEVVLYQGDIVTVSARIENRGSIDAANFSVGFYDNISGNILLVNRTNVSSLSTGNYIYINTTWDLLNTSIGNHLMQVRIDHFNNPENNITNNYKNNYISVISPWEVNISFPSFPEDVTIREGENLTIVATVTNKGIRDVFATVKFYSDCIYVDNILFNEQEIYVAGNSTNTTEVVWNVRPLFPAPKSDLITSRTIFANVGSIYSQDYLINIETADLTIEDVVIDSDYNITITVKNNENRNIHPTFWFYDVNHTVCDIVPNKDFGNYVEGVYSITHPDARNMSIYFIEMASMKGDEDAWYRVVDKNNNIVEPEIILIGTGTKVGDYWTKWGAGNTINLAHEYIKGTIKSAALLEYRHLLLNAGETKNFTVQWNAIMGEDHTIWVQLSNETQHKNISLNIDLAVTDVMANSTTSDGNPETITATITNLGCGNASNFNVKFFVDDPNRLFYTENVTNLDSNTTTTITTNWTACTWNECEGIATLNHTIWVEIDRFGNSDLNEDNNRKSRSIQVNPTRDFSVTNISFVQNVENEHITINATIENFGIPGSANVSIHAEKDGKNYPVYSATQLIDVKHYVNEQLDNASITGHYTINAAVDPDSRTLEINESNNTMMLPVYIEAPDLTVVNLTIDDSNPLEGDMVNITAEIANVGDRPVNASLTIYDSKRVSEECNEYIGPNRYTKKSEKISANNATAMRLYLCYKMSYGGCLRLYDSKDRLVSLKFLANDNFSGWTEWVVGDSITVELENMGGSAALMISKYDYLTTEDIIISTVQTTDTADFTINWNASTAGERNIVAIIYPENSIPELNEYNNSKTEFLRVRGADLTISDLHLTVNGSEINDTISNGTIVNINATITNIGVKPTAKDFNVTLVCDDIHGERIEITNVTIPYLNPDNSTNVIAIWNATIGDYTITAIADPENSIFETSNSNNTLSKNVVVLGADLSITGIKFRVLPPGGADINDASSPLYDTDTVVINATIKNQGLEQADNFSGYIFYEYEYLGNNYRERNWRGDGHDIWINKDYDGAECICIYITDTYNINDRLIVYDGNGIEVACPGKSCRILVMGDTANIKYSNVHGLGFTVDWYAGNITKLENLSLFPGNSINITMRQPVGTGNHPARVFADPRNIVPGDPDQNNCANLTLHVLPSRDFIPGIYLTHNRSGIEVNDTIGDGNTVTVDVDIRMDINESDPYNEYRNGTVDVDIIDEHKWIDASPRFELTDDGYAQVIRYPGADAIRVQFKELDVSPRDVVEIRDLSGTLLCTLSSYTPTSPWLDRDEIYFYKVQKPSDYGNYRYIACEIDNYQYRIINRTTVNVSTNETAHTSARFTPDAGNHTIRAVTDPDDEISEILESNNEANETIYIEPCCDPAVVDIAFSPEMPDPGTAVNITANVTNYGNITANFTIDLYATKFEYRPCESPHPDQNSQVNPVFELDIATYPEANWTGVHFTRISTDVSTMNDDETYLHVCDKGGNLSEDFYGLADEEDVWAWVTGDILEIETKLFCAAQRGCIWGFSIDTVAHTVILNQTTLTLEPGKTASVTGTLSNVRIGNQSFHYTITAVVDQDNTVFETNESNNVVSRELVAKCPDLKVDFNPPDEAVIRNIGTRVAEDVEVRLWHDASYSREKYRNGMKFPPKGEMPDDESDDELDAVRVHFEKLEFDLGEVWIRNENGDRIHTIYPGNHPDTWMEVEGKECGIYCDFEDVEDIEIDRYEYAYDKKVGEVPADNRTTTTIPWTEYEAPYNLTIDVDPENYVIESNEDNNNKTISIHADIIPQLIYFSKPDEDKLVVDLESTIEVTIMNDGTAPAGEFNITLEVTDVNGTVFFNQSRHTSLSARQSDKVEFVWTPSDPGNYIVSVITDSDGNVNELDENNNIRSRDIYVYPFSGYSGGGLLINYKQDVFHGDVIFTIGDSRRLPRASEGNTLRVTFDDAIPAKVKLARLYLYVDTGSDPGCKIALPIEVDMKFNGQGVQTDRKYTDISVASDWNVTYGLYCYDVTSYVDNEKENVAVATKISPKFENFIYFGIAAIGLLVVTEDDDAILTRYWINEGIDTVMAKNKNHNSGLPFGDCTVLAEFDDVEQEDLEAVNATLMAILSLVRDNKGDLYPEANGEGDVLRINEHQIGSLKNGSHWIYQKPDGVNTIAMTDNKWEYVTDNLKHGINLATFQSKGNYIVPSNAFLVLRYPPDLAVTDVDAPVSAVVGNKYVINTTISNEGRSNATDFNVSFYSNNVRIERQKISLLDSGDNITLQFNWKPMHMGKIYKLKVAADVISGQDWVELDADNNEMTKNVPIVGSGFGNESGPIGEGGDGAGGSGEGEGVSLFDTITGILMKGTILKDGGGGSGGIGEFSLLEWLMKGLILATCSLLVYFGYSMEKRRHNKR